MTRLNESGFEEERLATLEWAYLPLFRHEPVEPGVLQRWLATKPSFFVEIVSLAYKGRTEDTKELTDEQRNQAIRAHDLLELWRLLPGLMDDGSLDFDTLVHWVKETRNLLSDVDRLAVGEQLIGELLCHGPGPENGIWPAQPIRDLIEEIESEHIETGFRIEVYNSR